MVIKFWGASRLSLLQGRTDSNLGMIWSISLILEQFPATIMCKNAKSVLGSLLSALVDLLTKLAEAGDYSREIKVTCAIKCVTFGNDIKVIEFVTKQSKK